jgi:hypothetical protein
VDIGKADFSKAKIRKSKRRSKSKTRQDLLLLWQAKSLEKQLQKNMNDIL